MAQASYDRGKVPPLFRLERITMTFKPTDTQQAELDTLLKQQQDPASPNYHKWTSPEQFADRFGISANDLDSIVEWLRAQGFTVDEVARNRRWVTFTGSASQVETAFRTPIHEYVVDGETFYANVNDPYVPDALANVVMGFRSLNNFRLKARARRLRVNAANPQFTSSTSGNHFLAPADFATIYNLSGLYASGLDGTGQTIAIMGQTNIDLNDLHAFRSASGLAPNDPDVVLVPGSSDPGTNNNDLGEANLDLEWAGAVARNAHLIYVNSNDGAFDSLQYTIDQNLAPVISISYGACERTFSQQEINILSAMGQQATAQGMTILAASGDSGAADCDYNVRTASHGLAVDVPASLPYVTGLGGSEFNEGSSSWSATNNAMSGSAFSYISEMTWNDSANSVLSAGGGGSSIYFSKPEWQVGSGVPNNLARNVPDVSLTASAQHDGYLVCSLGSCVNGFRASDGTLNVAGGTSAGAPTFAGIVAILNQATNSRQGNINPALYRLAGVAPAVFHDITTGGNQVSCRLGTIDCLNGGTIGYAATAGYDRATGLGSVDGAALITSWPLVVTPAPQTSPSPSSGGTTPVSNPPAPQPITAVEQGTTRSGYVIITPDANSPAPAASETFGIVSNGIVQAQAGILPAALTTSSTLVINIVPAIGRNLGVAIANPGTSTNAVTLTLQDVNGSTVATTTVQLAAHQQVARFVSEFLGSSTVGTAFTGSLHLQSQTPFAVLGLRFSGAEFSTLPVIGAPAPFGGSTPTVVPQFAIGGGWTSEIALFNDGTSVVTGHVDIFDTNGNPMTVTLNNTTQSTFRYSIPAGGTFILAPRDANGQTPM
jgi:subtilase family serine protease